MARSTSPANTFPKRRNENDIILANSEISSSMPMKKSIGPLKLKKTERQDFSPTAEMLSAFMKVHRRSEPGPMVKLRSLAGDLSRGTDAPLWLLKSSLLLAKGQPIGE